MNFFTDFFNLLLHFSPETLAHFINDYQSIIYVILFVIIFVETGLVVMPFLPGDSLLFAVGMMCATDTLSIYVAIPLLILAAFSGDNTNYFIGNKIGVKIFDMNFRFVKREYLTRTEEFFEKHGGKAIIIARYVPIVRTFTPFVAGIGSMFYPRFATFSFVAACIWVAGFITLGYALGHNEFVQKNFDKVLLAIISTSFIPIIYQFLKNKFAKAV